MLFEKTAIVTGAASGIGYAVAQALRQEGAQVVMADVNEALLIESARELGGVPFVGNLTRREDCRRLGYRCRIAGGKPGRRGEYTRKGQRLRIEYKGDTAG